MKLGQRLSNRPTLTVCILYIFICRFRVYVVGHRIMLLFYRSGVEHQHDLAFALYRIWGYVYRLLQRLSRGMNASPFSQYKSSVFSGRHREYRLSVLTLSTLNGSSYPLADDEHPNVNSAPLKRHLCLPKLNKFEIMLPEARGVVQ